MFETNTILLWFLANSEEHLALTIKKETKYSREIALEEFWEAWH